MSCVCEERRQKWEHEHCYTCHQDLDETQIQVRIHRILTSGTGVVLWRNNIGTAFYRDKDSGKIERTVAFGVGRPGGADLIGGYRGRFLAVETKSRSGQQSRDQIEFQHVVEHVIGGIYALVRSESQAKELLARLQRM